MKKEERDILIKVINKFGKNNQIIKSIEELGELITALARKFTKQELVNNNICEEIADVEIMLEQLKIIFDRETIEHYKSMKLNKLNEILKGDNSNEQNIV